MQTLTLFPNRTTWRGHVPPVLRELTNGKPRAAFDDQSRDELAAILSALADSGGGFTDGTLAGQLDGMKESVPDLFLQRPTLAADLDKLAAPFREVLSGNFPANPFASDTVQPDEQALLLAVAPDLAAYLKRIADGPSYRALHSFNLEQRQRREVAAFKYDDAAHAANAWVRHDRLAQDAVRKGNSFLADFFERNAKPMRLNPYGPAVNRTEQARILQVNPAHAQLLERAAITHTNWLGEELRSLEADVQRAADAKAAAEAKLRGKR